MASSHQEFNNDHTPLAFFITFRTYGTWLHGDRRGSVDRLHNAYGTPKLSPNRLRQQYERQLLKRPPVRLTTTQRAAAADGIRQVCKHKKWNLWTVNVRTNHVHVVVTADCNSKKVRSTLKAFAAKVMRERGCWCSDDSPWAARGSRIPLWTYKEMIDAIVYVLYEQGE